MSARRAAWGIGALAAALPPLVVAALVLGETHVPWEDLRALFAGDAVDAVARAKVLDLRLPEVLVAALVGGSLALAGVLLQGIFRNPLAEPGILGISTGGSFGAVLALFTGAATLHPLVVPASAFGAATAVAFFVYTIGTRGGRTQIATLLLAGIAVQAFVSSLSAGVIAVAAKRWDVARTIVAWTLGGLEDRTWDHVAVVAPSAALALAAAAFVCRELNVLALGETSARALGVDTRALKRNVLVLAALAAGAAVSVSGSIAFVGLIVPHVLRRLVGPDHRVLVPAGFLGGACFLVALDLCQRWIVRGMLDAPELRIGILTGLLGAPFFLYLLLSQAERASGVD